MYIILYNIFVLSILIITIDGETCPMRGDIRYDSSSGALQGALQVCEFPTGSSSLQWLYVCSNMWDNGFHESDTWCRQLGYIDGSDGGDETSNINNGEYKLRNVDCNQNDMRIIDCNYNLDNRRCRYEKDVVCTNCDNNNQCNNPGACNMTSGRCECIGECMNGGYCYLGVCVCPTNFTGSLCEDCNPACQNNGACNSSGVCVCPYGYTGSTCETVSSTTTLMTTTSTTLTTTSTTQITTPDTTSMQTTITTDTISISQTTTAPNNSITQTTITTPDTSTIQTTVTTPDTSTTQTTITTPDSSTTQTTVTTPDTSTTQTTVTTPPDTSTTQTTVTTPDTSTTQTTVTTPDTTATQTTTSDIQSQTTITTEVQINESITTSAQTTNSTNPEPVINNAQSMLIIILPIVIILIVITLVVLVAVLIAIFWVIRRRNKKSKAAQETAFENTNIEITDNINNNNINANFFKDTPTKLSRKISLISRSESNQYSTINDYTIYESPNGINEEATQSYINPKRTDNYEGFKTNTDPDYEYSYSIPTDYEHLKISAWQEAIYAECQENPPEYKIYEIPEYKINEIPEYKINEIAEYKIYEQEDNADSIYQEPPKILNQLINTMDKKTYQHVDPTRLHLQKEIGKGEYGIVCKALWEPMLGTSIPVAVKQIKESSSEEVRIAFMREAAIMKQFSHNNILRILGIINQSEPFMIITELMKIELREMLLKYNFSGFDKDKCHPMLLKFSQEIAAGMEYLAKKKFIHRDLAARNVLVSNQLTCKISDFGMSRELRVENDYYTSSGGLIPIKWTAPEAIFFRKFSEKSDVWSFGMVMFEIWSLGCKPWNKLKPQEIINKINLKRPHPPPTGCPREIYSVMIEALRYDAEYRPAFTGVCEMLNMQYLPLDTTVNSPEDVLGNDPQLAEMKFMDLQTKYYS